MSNRIFSLAFAAILALSVAQKCGRSCKFQFCKADGFDTVIDDVTPRIFLRDAGISTHPFVCSRIGTSGRIKVLKTKPSMVYSGAQIGLNPEPFVPVTAFRKKPKFPKNYFGLKTIGAFPPIPNEKGVFRSKAGNKFEAASDDLCVKIPITSYTVNGAKVNTNDPDDCVAFRTIVPKILIEATWDSGDDLDINVLEPTGELIDFGNQNSGTGGRLVRDQNPDSCNVDPDGREQIRWLLTDKPKKGLYTVQIRHFNNCGKGATKWNVAIIIRGKLVTNRSGTSNLMTEDALIEEFTFNFSG